MLVEPEIYRLIQGSSWRAGHLDQIRFDAPARRVTVLAELLGSRVASLAHAFEVQIDRVGDLAEILSQLARTTCRQSLRELEIGAFWKPAAQPATFDASLLAPMPRSFR